MSGENIYNWRTKPPVVIEKEPMYVISYLFSRQDEIETEKKLRSSAVSYAAEFAV